MFSQSGEIRPGRLWSLLEIMESVNVGLLVQAVHSLTVTTSLCLGTNDAAPLAREWRELILKDVRNLLGECERLGLLVPSEHCRGAIEMLNMGGGPGETGGIVRIASMIANTIQIEMKAKRYFALKPEMLRFYEPSEPIFGLDFQNKFTSAAFEIDEAAKCHALDRHTATVFHLMRVMEIGVRSVARCLSIPDPIKDADRNWGRLLEKIKQEMDQRNALRPALWSAASDREFFAEVYVSLDAVRVAWRNTTMHVESKYTADEAEHIFVAVRGFMKKLASRHDEQGQPLA